MPACLRHRLQQHTDTAVTMIAATPANPTITHSHILSEHRGIAHSSIDFSSEPRLLSTKHHGPASEPPGFRQ